MKQAYVDSKFRQSSLLLIQKMNVIIDEYTRTRDTLTVRQLYYQLVARGIIPNTERSYKNTTSLVNDARMCGLIDWDAIEDRTREMVTRGRWRSPVSMIEACAQQYHQDLWEGQEYRVFAIVEKEALAGALGRVCTEMDIPLLPARGYPSSTVLREVALQTLRPAVCAGQQVIILHLGDHDPSGIDMTRDLDKRIETFMGEYAEHVQLRRIALSMQQIEEEKPPPNPAKQTDSRFDGYAKLFGDQSWELDALSPTYLRALVRTEAEKYIDEDKMQDIRDEIADIKSRLEDVAEEFRGKEEND